MNLDIRCFSLFFHVAFVLKNNVNEKTIQKYWNINVRIRVNLGLQEIGSWINICHGTIICSYYSSMHLLCGFNEQLRYYCESANRNIFSPSSKNWPEQKLLDPQKKIWPTKRCTQKYLVPRKKVWLMQKYIWPTQPT